MLDARALSCLAALAVLVSCGGAAVEGGDAASLRVTPTAREVARTLVALTPRVVACGLAPGEEVHVRITFAYDGRVLAAEAPGPNHACIERVLVDARLAPFRQAAFRVSFPFRALPAPPAASPATPEVPDTPTRDAVMAALRVGRDAIRACNGGSAGMFSITIHFVSDGHAVSVDAAPGTPKAACVLDAAALVRLPPFRAPAFMVTYPFEL